MGSQDEQMLPPFDETRGLQDFASRICKYDDWITADEILFEWVKAISGSYAAFKWSDTMKVAVVQMLNRVDAVLYKHIMAEFELLSGEPEKLVYLVTERVGTTARSSTS